MYLIHMTYVYSVQNMYKIVIYGYNMYILHVYHMYMIYNILL